MITLLDRAASITRHKLLKTCVERGLAPVSQRCGSGTLRLRAPKFLTLNPNALLPATQELRIRRQWQLRAVSAI